MANLLSNAFRHSRSGDTVSVRGRQATNEYEIAVSDQGPGVPPELLPHIFERFVKGADSKGTGLGLSIARDLVQAHGGDISVMNLPGGGTSLIIRLPR
jgi:signal transduction histidine kinase